MVRTIRDGGGTGPSPQDQAEAAKSARASADAAKETVAVRGKDGLERMGTGPISFQGNGIDSVAYDPEEGQTVVTVTVPILISTAAERPADPGRPSLHIATDTGAHSSWDGTTWRTI